MHAGRSDVSLGVLMSEGVAWAEPQPYLFLPVLRPGHILSLKAPARPQMKQEDSRVHFQAQVCEVRAESPRWAGLGTRALPVTTHRSCCTAASWCQVKLVTPHGFLSDFIVMVTCG